MEARAAGVQILLDGEDLVLEASSPPPESVLDALSRNKVGIVTLLRLANDGWSSDDWQAFFDERAGIAEFDAGQTPEQAETTAFECCMVEWLDRHLFRTDPGRCAACGEPDRDGHTVVPYGAESHGHTWLHPACRGDWNRYRRQQARQFLEGAGIRGRSEATERTKFPNDLGKNGGA
tara:strand:- start:19944 stop:20474 length:531 start_codon:yes stop_codon:yes gene_type:complete